MGAPGTTVADVGICRSLGTNSLKEDKVVGGPFLSLRIIFSLLGASGNPRLSFERLPQ